MTHMEFIERVLVSADRKCRERYHASLYSLCGLDEGKVGIINELMANGELQGVLATGTLSFLRLLPSFGWKIASSISVHAGSMQLERLLKEIRQNPVLYNACRVIDEKYRELCDDDAASEDLIRMLGIDAEV